MDGPANPGGSVMSMSMMRSMDRGALTMLREHTADRLATTVQVLHVLFQLCWRCSIGLCYRKLLRTIFWPWWRCAIFSSTWYKNQALDI